MTEGISDFIITMSIAIGTLATRLFFKKLKWGWQLLVTLTIAIFVSILGHLIVKLCL